VGRALEWLAEDFSRRNGMPCHVLVDGGEPTIADSHATAIFRIAQEYRKRTVRRHAHFHLHPAAGRNADMMPFPRNPIDP
jgi:signal transduction histidine kinase